LIPDDGILRQGRQAHGREEEKEKAFHVALYDLYLSFQPQIYSLFSNRLHRKRIFFIKDT
jgi:hypothetical protein